MLIYLKGPPGQTGFPGLVGPQGPKGERGESIRGESGILFLKKTKHEFKLLY